MYKTIAQALSKFFEKTPAEYVLNQDAAQCETGANPSMKHMIVAALLQLKDHKGDIKQIKAKVVELFDERIRSQFVDLTRANSNLKEWEKTFLKTFSRHKNVFLQNKAMFCLNKTVIANNE